MAQDRHTSEKATLGVILWSRVIINLPLRLTYPFLRAISDGLGVSLAAASALVSVRSLAGVCAPLFGVLTDRLGERRVMSLGIALLVLGTALTAGLPVYGVAMVGFGLIGLSKSAYDPAMQAFVGRRVPYERRGWALGITELSWSATWLGIPLCGWLIEHVDWRLPFGLIALLGIFAGWLTRRTLAPDPERSPGDEKTGADLFFSVRQLWHDRYTWLALTITALLMLAQDNIIIVYGVWIEDSFGLSVTAIGVVSLVIGVAEASGELGVALLSDRWGKRRAVFFGLIATSGGYLLLPQLNGNLVVTLIGTAFVILVFEFSVVAYIPLVSGLNASARGTLMSFNVAAFAVGRMAAAPLAVALYRPGDLARNGALSAFVCLLALGMLSCLRERGH